ncbi:hypothetical protein L7F22_041362 [Adiantum nelumboides]|nr:hypothetical protein [Adiantum nelumboides]
MSFPTFNGAASEDVQEFLDNLEIACLVIGRDDGGTRFDGGQNEENQAEVGAQPTQRVANVEQLQQNMQDMMTMMQELRLNVLGGGGGRGHGQGRGVAQPYEVQPNANLGRGQGAFEPPRRFIPTCYNCGELSHIRTQCPRPIRMGGDMFPLPQQIPKKANDYALDKMGDQGAEQENQASTLGGHVGIVRVEKKEADMMPLGKREREGYAAPGPSKKKGKEKEGEDAKAKRKRRPRKKFEVTDLPLGEGQIAYDLKEDLSGRKIDCTFGQLMNMVPKLKRQWKSLVNPVKEPKHGQVRVLVRMKKDTSDYVRRCLICQKTKAERVKIPGKLQSLDIPQMKWECISMDFVTGLPKTTENYDSIFVIVDKLTKVAHLIPVKQTATAADIAQVFVKEIVRLHGIPARIISDQDAKFTSKFWQAMFQSLGTQLNLSTAYHPETDGQT